mmetsp:Transcript_267/g.814  ORF Transcript_267/g.814 Transcript_267/m.814 type:complete len:216 (+) Transcript_267:2126-2773(+)
MAGTCLTSRVDLTMTRSANEEPTSSRPEASLAVMADASRASLAPVRAATSAGAASVNVRPMNPKNSPEYSSPWRTIRALSLKMRSNWALGRSERSSVDGWMRPLNLSPSAAAERASSRSLPVKAAESASAALACASSSARCFARSSSSLYFSISASTSCARARGSKGRDSTAAASNAMPCMAAVTDTAWRTRDGFLHSYTVKYALRVRSVCTSET